jgi:L-histidine Nalpha-methyltransferase
MKSLLKEKEIELDDFGKDVMSGLSASPKKLSPKYLYDGKGSKLFEEIMNLPEYYPTKCELEILENYKKQLIEFFPSGETLDIVDLGAGNGQKAMILISFFLRRINFKYIPVDISSSAVKELESTLKKKYPKLNVQGLDAEYIQGLKMLKKEDTNKKLVLFLGSNIGNFTFREAFHFLKNLRESLNKGDLLIIGFDLKKDPLKIRMAYNDKTGTTAQFNLNILERINKELGGNFNPLKFSFYSNYDPITGEVRSYLVSNERQDVYIEKLDQTFAFEKWETIHTECSNKFDLTTIERLAEVTGFSVEANFFDSQEYFVDSLWRVK